MVYHPFKVFKTTLETVHSVVRKSGLKARLGSAKPVVEGEKPSPPAHGSIKVNYEKGGRIIIWTPPFKKVLWLVRAIQFGKPRVQVNYSYERTNSAQAIASALKEKGMRVTLQRFPVSNQILDSRLSRGE